MLLVAAIPLVASIQVVAGEKTIPVTAENFSHAETARNYRNWARQGANTVFVKMPGKGYNAILRLYGPLEPWFEKSWMPGDFEPVK